MDYALFNSALGLIVQLFAWSTLLILVVVGSTRLIPYLQYWSALWKVTLVLCLLPLVPWSQLALPVLDFSVSGQLIPALPGLWAEGGTLGHYASHGAGANAEQTAVVHLIVLTVSSVAIVSLFKTLLFAFKLIHFNRALSACEVLRTDSVAMRFLTDRQRADLDARNIRILRSQGSTSPFATGITEASIVLPASFFVLPTTQQRLLIEHEMRHIERGDLMWLMLTQVSRCLLWFAPAVHLLKSKMDLAIEVECDRQVLSTFPDMAKEYGSALINIVRHTRQRISPQAVFFNNQQLADLKRRITFTQNPVTEHGRNLMNKITLSAAALFFSATSWALNTNTPNLMSVEDFIALHKHASRYLEDNGASPTLPGNWVNPVDSSWVSSRFKAIQKLRKYKPHLGIDLASVVGAPIVAARNGVVIIADSDSLHKDHGNVVVIDHGEGVLSMYSHLDSFEVRKGDNVEAGQLIGKIGVTGKSTGPHLHFEIITANQHIDPASIIEFSYR